jgi:hypothetical protein
VGGDVGDALAASTMPLKAIELVGRVHGLAQRVLGGAGLERDVVVGDHAARHVEVGPIEPVVASCRSAARRRPPAMTS